MCISYFHTNRLVPNYSPSPIYIYIYFVVYYVYMHHIPPYIHYTPFHISYPYIVFIHILFDRIYHILYISLYCVYLLHTHQNTISYTLYRYALYIIHVLPNFNIYQWSCRGEHYKYYYYVIVNAHNFYV